MKTTTRALFIRAGWMVWYDFKKEPNGPIGGGAYNVDNYGSEADNFRAWRSRLYGFVQTPSGGINLSRIPDAEGLEQIDDVLVLAYATAPGRSGQRLVGWYSAATCHGRRQERRPGGLHGIWNIQAPRDRAVLLPLNSRTRFAPARGAGGFGQSNVRYVLDQGGHDVLLPWMQEHIDYVRKYSGPSLLAGDDPGALPDDLSDTDGGQGWHSDPEAQRAVEQHAMGVAATFFRRRGYTVDSEVHRYRPFDLFCVHEKTREVLRVEVKGSSMDVDEVFLTSGEVDSAREVEPPTALFVVSNISLRRYRGRYRASGGTARWLSDWTPSERHLRPLQFRYRLPKMKRVNV